MRQLCRHVEIIAVITVSNHFIFVQCLFVAHCSLALFVCVFVLFSLSIHLYLQYEIFIRSSLLFSSI